MTRPGTIRPVTTQQGPARYDPTQLVHPQGSGQRGGAAEPGGLAVVPSGQTHTGTDLGSNVQGSAAPPGVIRNLT